MDGDPPRLDQAGDPLDELVDDLVLEGSDRGPVGIAGGLDAPFLGAVDGVHHRCRLEQRLGRDATSQQTGTAQPVVAVDEGYPFAQLCGPESG
jgi:hypothetical protein